MKFTIHIKRLLVSILFLLIGFQNSIHAQEDPCPLDILNNELIEANSEQVFKHFETHAENAYDAWRILYEADKNADRLDIVNLEKVSDYLVSVQKSTDEVIDEIRVAGSYSSWEKTAFGSPTNSAKKLKEDVEKIYDDYFDNDLTKEILIANIQRAIKESFLPESIKSAIAKIEDYSALSNVIRVGGEELFALSSSSNSVLVNYAANLIEARATSKIVDDKTFKTAIRDAEEVHRLPAIDAVEITNGSGGLGRIFSGEYNGQSAIFKFDKTGKQDYDTVQEIEDVAKALEPYDGPKVLGRVRVKDINGVWQEAVALEKIEGHDLFRLSTQFKNGEALDLQVTETHLNKIDEITERLASEGKFFDETNLGDFMLTKNPDRPVVPLDMFVKSGNKNAQGLLDHQGLPIRNTVVELINSPAAGLAKYNNIRKHIGDGRIKAYLNTAEANTFTEILRKGHADVLQEIDKMDVDDFGEMVRGYKDNPKAFEDSLADLNKFSGNYGWLTYWKLTPDIKNSFKTLREDLKDKDLLPTGDATEIELATLHAFTVKGDFINVPLRYNQSYLGTYAARGVKHLQSALDKLRKVDSRRIMGEVFSGKTFSKTDFESQFVGGTGKTISYNSFVSSTLKKEVAEGFIKLTAQHAGSGEKIAVIQRILTKNGVYIDDLSDWGKHLGKQRHADADAAVQVQEEVLINAGSFKQTAEPIAIKDVNGQHLEIGGYKAYYVDLIEL